MASQPEQLISQVFSLLPGNVTTATGRRETEAFQVSPFVVGVPLGAPEIKEADRIGGGTFLDDANTQQARIVLVRQFRIEWWCFGAPTNPQRAPDYTTAELTYLTTLLTIRNLWHNSVQFSDEEWLDQKPQGDGFERSGTTITFVSTVQIPIYDTPETAVSLTGTPKIVTTVTLGTETVTVNNG